ncbi:MAG: CO dehydrogenase/CO-methylating acetyl-CoA synthase complex subunit beta, partial [Methermicoccaceae archaeon]
CQSFAPSNVCVVTPDRISLCGAINWFDGRAAAKVDPEGPQFPIPKGECIDEIGGEYTGVNEKAVELSGGEYSRIKLHSFFEYPHTSCGCFEVVGFYIPEVDGIGWVDRDFDGIAPNGLPFSTMAGQTGGGKQIIGFLGIGINYFRSPKFIQADGGWNRTVWLTKRLKDKVYDDIPEEVRDAIPTEEEATDLDSLRQYLIDHSHPIVETWKEEEKVEEEKPAEEPAQQPPVGMQMPMGMPMQPIQGFVPPPSQGGSGVKIKISLKNAVVKIGKLELKEESKK